MILKPSNNFLLFTLSLFWTDFCAFNPYGTPFNKGLITELPVNDPIDSIDLE